ncbi:MAG: hypothetical protein H0X24_13425 [Ktedonobacterales bacterium]|nr:hypothetical protein [Ktedonobacterales bacterium]
MMPEERSCSKYGMTQSEWRGNDGSGYDADGQTYCCVGCYDDTGCTCHAES